MTRPIPQKARIPGKARIRLRPQPAATRPFPGAAPGQRGPRDAAGRLIFTDWAAI
ncbi:hypothetical protein [Alkalilacustris brevis]|uniref:hypothetical protein n=1 Tax=Alkalilacustris brevis TaxID=2026338 RepID=UPI0012D2A7C4|nr:hypothetical protein [Alkalilacustris brevis]